MTRLPLRNPHSVLAALQHRPQDVVEIRVSRSTPDGQWRDVVELARQTNVHVRSERHTGSVRGASKDRRTGAGEADVRPRSDVSLEELFSSPQEPWGLWLALDHLQDPHNVGAVFRTAAFYGVRGIVLTKDRSAPLSATVYDVASGGMESVPFSEQTNLSRTIDVAKQAGLWVLGTSERATLDVGDIPRDRHWLLVLGNEQKGVGQLVGKNCDEFCRLTPRGDVTSLNVSVAAGIMIATLTR